MEVMTDIEIYSDGNGHRVFQLSSVAFDLDGRVNAPHELLQGEDCCFDEVTTTYPFPIEQSTIEWWARPEQAHAALILNNASREDESALPEMLERYSYFLRNRLGSRGGHWANPPAFDLKIVRDLYDYAGYRPPWKYSQQRDMRTIMELARRLSPAKRPAIDETGLTKHVGLHDAVRQAVLVQAAYKVLGLSAGNFARATRSAPVSDGPVPGAGTSILRS